MEDRVTTQPEHPGAALIALTGILGITAAWWALALWPAGAVEPEWLARTRSACFGSARNGLPDAGGWVLLIGEPIGMFGFLMAVWGRAVRRDLAWVIAHPRWRLVAATVAVLTLTGIAAASARVARVAGMAGTAAAGPAGTPVRVDREPPAVALIDQRGHPTALTDFKGQPVLLTFAFGHCTTVCPAMVTDVIAARRTANRQDVPLVVITLDPWRDTPERLGAIAARWGLTPNDRLLSGGLDDVRQVLDDLGVGGRRNTTTGDVDHAATVMLLDAQGRIRWRVEGGWQGAVELLSKL